MIKSNLISASTLSDGNVTFDLTSLTENYNRENMKKIPSVVTCEKLSNGQETFLLSDIKAMSKKIPDIPYTVDVKYNNDNSEIVSLQFTGVIHHQFSIAEARNQLLQTCPSDSSGIILLLYQYGYCEARVIRGRESIDNVVTTIESAREAQGQSSKPDNEIHCLENFCFMIGYSDWLQPNFPELLSITKMDLKFITRVYNGNDPVLFGYTIAQYADKSFMFDRYEQTN